MPLSVIQPGAATISALHTDNIDTIQRATNSSKTIVWTGNYEPFGAVTPTTTITQNQRFLNNYADNTGYYHNGFRDRNPTSTVGGGRFLQVDPCNASGLNPYVYLNNNPYRHLDPTGCAWWGKWLGTWGGRLLGGVAGEAAEPLGGGLPGEIIGGKIGGEVGDKASDAVDEAIDSAIKDAAEGPEAGQQAAEEELNPDALGKGGDCPICDEEARNALPTDEAQIGHIFRDAEGHLQDSPENRALLESVANDPENQLGTDSWGNTWVGSIPSGWPSSLDFFARRRHKKRRNKPDTENLQSKNRAFFR
jgi:RHS repeat-associated protein